MESVDKNVICRLCLLGSANLTSIFQVYDRNGFIAADLIKDLLHFKVSKTDGYPPVVCRSCLCNLTNFKHFKEQCITSKATYDNVFSPSEEILDSTLQSDITTMKEEEVDIDFSSDVRSKEQIEGDLTETTIKQEEVDVNFNYGSRSKGQIEEDITEVSCDPILLNYEMLPFKGGDHSQERGDPLLSVSDEEGESEGSTTMLRIVRGKSKSEVVKCRDLQVNETNNGKGIAEHPSYGSKCKEQLRGMNNETPLERRRRLARERKQRWWAKQTGLSLKKIREANAARIARSRMNESPEQRQQRRLDDARRHARRHAQLQNNETEEQMAQRRDGC